jgi:hypothetical protein
MVHVIYRKIDWRQTATMARTRDASVHTALCLIVLLYSVMMQAICASLQRHELLPEKRNMEISSSTVRAPSVVSTKSVTSSQQRKRSDLKKTKEQTRVRPLVLGDSTLGNREKRSAIYDDTEISSRQAVQPTTASPSTTSTIASSNNQTVKGKAPVVAVKFTLSPIMVPVSAPTPTNAPTETNAPSHKPVVSIPLTIHVSPAPTTFFAHNSSSPSVQPSPVTVIIATTDVPVVVTNSSQDVDPISVNAATEETTTSRKANSGAIAGIVIAVIASMLLSVLVFMARHKYVQKHGEVSTRSSRRRNRTLLPVGTDFNVSDHPARDDLKNGKTVHIIATNDGSDIPQERTFEIHLEDDVPFDSQQESSFISTSGGEEIESDLDNGVTIKMANAKKKNPVS